MLLLPVNGDEYGTVLLTSVVIVDVSVNGLNATVDFVVSAAACGCNTDIVKGLFVGTDDCCSVVVDEGLNNPLPKTGAVVELVIDGKLGENETTGLLVEKEENETAGFDSGSFVTVVIGGLVRNENGEGCC